MQFMLVSRLINTLEASMRSIISYQEDMKVLWEDIKERYYGKSMITYYGKLKSSWDELTNHQQIPKYTYERMQV